MNWDGLILAAGEGTRMLSKTPKVLHKVGGHPMIKRIIDALISAGAQKIHVVVSENIKPDLLPLKDRYKNLEFYIQKQAKGTADAVKTVIDASPKDLSKNLFICNGDHPLINAHDITQMISDTNQNKSILTVGLLKVKKPGAFGRALLDKNGNLSEIIEAKFCSKEQLKINLVNSGIYYGFTENIVDFLESEESITKKSSEFYLTDVVKYLADKGLKVSGYITTAKMGFGVNDSLALSKANQVAYINHNIELMQKGVKFINYKNVYIDEGVEIEPDVLVYPNVFMSGKTHIKAGTIIETNVFLRDSLVGQNVIIKAGSYIEGAKIMGNSSIGPYAHLREGAEIHENVKVGNFAEIKKSILREGVKAGHQCYIGDADVGENTNIGAGTITCNFAVDGKKYKTKIGKNVFVGSDTQIVPPIQIEDGAVLAAGSTVTKDVVANSLYVTRAKSVVKKNYRK